MYINKILYSVKIKKHGWVTQAINAKKNIFKHLKHDCFIVSLWLTLFLQQPSNSSFIKKEIDETVEMIDDVTKHHSSSKYSSGFNLDSDATNTNYGDANDLNFKEKVV